MSDLDEFTLRRAMRDPVGTWEAHLDASEKVAAELHRLGTGVEALIAEYAEDRPEVADALRRLLSGRA